MSTPCLLQVIKDQESLISSLQKELVETKVLLMLEKERVDTLAKEVSSLKEDLCKRGTLIALLDKSINALHKENLYLTEIVNEQRGL